MSVHRTNEDESLKGQALAIDNAEIRDNSVTLIIKHTGVMYAMGAEIGEITPDMPDEDLDSILRGLAGLGINMQRTVATQLAGRDENYVLAQANVVDEEDLTPPVYSAMEDIKKGEVVEVNPNTGHAFIHRDENSTDTE